MRLGFPLITAWMLVSSGSAAALDEFLHGPYLHASEPGTMTVTWTTANECIGTLSYGTYMNMKKVSDPERTTRHVMTLTGLEPGRLYQYTVWGGPGGTFRPGPVDDDRFTFTAAGDTRTQPFYHRVVLDRVLAVWPELHINTGDLVESGEAASHWDEFFAVEHDLLRHVPFLPVMGNHDKDVNTLYDEIWEIPGVRDDARAYSLRYGNALFLVLDYERIGASDNVQDRWVQEELEAAAGDSSIRHIFPAYHNPPLSSGHHGNSTNEYMLGWLHDAFKAAGVRVVLNGHDHNYERSLYDGIHYLVAGGGGAPKRGSMADPPENPQEHSVVFAYEYNFVQVDVDGGQIVLTAFNMDGDVIDRVEIGDASGLGG